MVNLYLNVVMIIVVPFENPIPVTSLAQAYVPFQKICGYFEPREALKEGTIFPSLTGLYNYNKEW